MARVVFVLEEIVAMLQVAKVPDKHIDAFRQQAEFVGKKKGAKQHDFDNVIVSSGYGQKAQKGHVELIVNDHVTQMDVAKATEIGLMLLQCAEAAQSDEVMVKLLDEMGLPPEARGPMLLKLRELRQGTKGVSYPS